MNIKDWSMYRGDGRYGKRQRCCGCDLPVKALAMCLGMVLIVRGAVGGWNAFFADQGHSAAFPLLAGPTIVAYATIDLAFTICALVGVVGVSQDQILSTHVAFRLGIFLTVASAVDGIVNVVFSVLARDAYLGQCVGPGNDSGNMMGDCNGTWNVEIAATVVAWVGNLVINLVFARLLVLHKREIFSKMVDSTPPRHDLHTTVSATVASLVSSETRLSQVDEEQQARSSAAWSVEDEQRIRMEMESIRTEMATVEIARSPLVGSSELQSPKRQAEMSKLESPRLVDRDSGVFIPMHIPAITPIPTSVPMPTSMAIPDLPPNLVPHQETSSKPVPSSINDPTSTSRPRPPAYAARLHTSLMGPRGPRKTPYQSRSGNVGVGARTRKDLDV